MNEILKIILSLSFSGSLLILVLFLLNSVTKKRLSRQWQYYIWLVVIARLLLPFAPEKAPVGIVFQEVIDSTSVILQPNHNTGIGSADNQTKPPISLTQEGVVETVLSNSGLIWLWVALLLFIRKMTIYQSFLRYIKAGRIEVSNLEELEQFGKIIEEAKIKQTIGLYKHSLISSPLLIGFFRPCIVLPSTDLTLSDFRYTILHELKHYKRHDMFYKWLIQITICLHWFNPLMYLMEREINRACELSCDEAVIRNLDYVSIRAYGDTLLNAMGAGGPYHNSLASLTLNEGKELLKERLDTMINFKKKSKFVVAITILLTMFLCIGATAVGAYAAPKTLTSNLSSSNVALGGSEMKTATILSSVYYLVETEQQLRSIGSEKYGLNQNYMLNNNITLTNEWTAIGDLDHPFTGTFDGNGFEIKNLKNTDPNAVFIGLFGCAEDATIHNVTLRNVDIASAGGKGKHVGAIVAMAISSKIYDNRIN